MTREEALKNAKPILFNTEMVKAIDEGRKTVTRRVIKPKFANTEIIVKAGKAFETLGTPTTVEIMPPYQVGDILYVRETWAYVQYMDMSGYVYKASAQAERVVCECANKGKPLKWSPSIHMPKEAARLFLRVTGVRVERTQDIITGDYKTPLNINHEGLILPCSRCTHHNGDCKDFIAQSACRLVDEYVNLWNGTVKKSDLGKYGWNANPWVRVIEFERVEVTE